MTRIIECQVSNEYVKGAGVVAGVAGSHHDVVLRLFFGPMWDGLTKSIVWHNSKGLNPVITLLTNGMRVDGQSNVYDVPIPAEPKEFEGKMVMSIKGATTSGGTETRATLAAKAEFVILPSKYDAEATAETDVNPSAAEQLQASIEEIEDVLPSIAIVGTTTYAEVAAAIAAGKAIFAVESDGKTLPYAALTDSGYVFSGMVGNSRHSVWVRSNDTWSDPNQTEIASSIPAFNSAVTISSLEDLKTQLSTWWTDVPQRTERLFYYIVSGSWSPFISGSGVLCMIERAASNGSASFYGRMSNGTSAYARMTYLSSSWSDFYVMATKDELQTAVDPLAPLANLSDSTPVDIASLSALKSQLSTWLGDMNDLSVAFYWVNITAAFGAFGVARDYLVRLQRTDEDNGIALFTCDHGSTARPLGGYQFSEIQMSLRSGSWLDPIQARARVGNYFSTGSRPTSPDITFSPYDGSMIHFKATTEMRDDAAWPGADGAILHFAWDGNSDNGSQLFVPHSVDTGAHVRARGSNDGVWGGWRSLAYRDEILGLIAPTFTAGDYAAGDYVIRNGLLYKALTTVTEADGWDADQWEQTTIMAEIKALR